MGMLPAKMLVIPDLVFGVSTDSLKSKSQPVPMEGL